MYRYHPLVSIFRVFPATRQKTRRNETEIEVQSVHLDGNRGSHAQSLGHGASALVNGFTRGKRRVGAMEIGKRHVYIMYPPVNEHSNGNHHLKEELHFHGCFSIVILVFGGVEDEKPITSHD